MKLRYAIACGFGLILLSTGCSQAPSPMAASVDTRATDEKMIRDGEVAWVADWRSKDVDKIVSHYADDANLLVAGMPIMSGKDAVKAGCKGLLEDPNLSLTFMAASVSISKTGDMAYTRGTYTMTMSDPKTKQPMTEKGKYLTIYRKSADGSWKAIEDMNNADGPAVPAK